MSAGTSENFKKTRELDGTEGFEIFVAVVLRMLDHGFRRRQKLDRPERGAVAFGGHGGNRNPFQKRELGLFSAKKRFELGFADRPDSPVVQKRNERTRFFFDLDLGACVSGIESGERGRLHLRLSDGIAQFG